MAKRKAGEDNDPTPRKTRRAAKEGADADLVASPKAAETRSGRKSILRGTPSKLDGIAEVEPTPKSLRKVLFNTPAKIDEEQRTPTADRTRNDRSAKRKSQRVLQKHIAAGDGSDDEDGEADEAVAQQILDEDHSSDEEDDEDIAIPEPTSAPDTPSKPGKLRGRPKGKRRERTPSPPPDLPPHELYFFQNRTGGNKTSANTLPSGLLLNHEDYFSAISAYSDPHADDIEQLRKLHERAFDQWVFEIQEGWNLCFYGYGSKRALLMDFIEHLHSQTEDRKKPKIVVVNGYAPGLTIRDVLITLASVVISKTANLPAQPQALLDLLLVALTDNIPASPIVLVIHSMDHSNLRKHQAMFATLASHSAVSLLASCDTPSFPLLWDLSLKTQLNLLFHDATTFAPYTAEIEVVEDVNGLLGRKGRRLGGKDGVVYVLRSLTGNARNLYALVVKEVLKQMDSAPAASFGAIPDDDDEMLGASDEEAAVSNTPSRRGRGRGRPAKSPKTIAAPILRPMGVGVGAEGVEYRTLYHKAVEDFICSSELNFRTLLKEFHDHAMVESRRDAGGVERLSIPGLGRGELEELEGVLEGEGS